MNYRLLTWVALAALLVVTALKDKSHQSVNTEAMLFKAPLISGYKRVTQFDLEARRGQVVVLDFWATWCGPCRVSLPALHEVAAFYADDEQVWVGSVNDERRSDLSLRGFLDQLKLDFPVIRDRGGAISRMYGVNALPTLIIIDPRGKIVYRQMGLVSRHTPKLVQHLKTHIEKARRGTP